MKILILLLFILVGPRLNAQYKFESTAVNFYSSDTTLQRIFDRAEEKAKQNIRNFGQYKVLVEGAGYDCVWLETQPMGGMMYAKRDIEAAINNVMIFMNFQRSDGRFPSVICNTDTILKLYFDQFSGLCFPMPAFELYFWLNRDVKFLQRLYDSLKKFDEYLWKTRDSDNNGCLETWCVFDTGEDNSSRFGKSPLSWPFDVPPKEEMIETHKQFFSLNHADTTMKFPVPIESMDIMSYSYTCRDVLSLSAAILGNRKEVYWRRKAEEIRRKLKSYLWDEKKHACYDRDRNNHKMDILLHNNLRCMYFGSFDQRMADDFIKYHLLNPDEFWTPSPLPSIAANDPMFRNIPGNNWSGQPQGLTFQRSISALENYGHYAEMTMIGETFLRKIGDSLKFVQQFDPFTGIGNNTSDGYGPAILSALEFISRLYGIHIAQDRINWSYLDKPGNCCYVQNWGDHSYKLETKGRKVYCSIDGNEVFSFSKGIRIVSDMQGRIKEVIGINPAKEGKVIEISYEGKTFTMSVTPNSVYTYKGRLIRKKSVKFSDLHKIRDKEAFTGNDVLQSGDAIKNKKSYYYRDSFQSVSLIPENIL
jgi:hypothetical protein